MGRLKCNWDRMVMPPEEMGRMKRFLLKFSLIASSIPIAIGILLATVYFLLWDVPGIIELSLIIIIVGLFIAGMMFMIASYVGNNKVHNVVKLYLKKISMDDAIHAMEEFLQKKGIAYRIKRPNRWKYRSLAFPPSVVFNIKKEFFIGIDYFRGSDNELIRQITIMYLPLIWDEALMFQKEMDFHFHRKGLAQPLEEGALLHFK
jgi:hypothetical protein